MNADGLLSYVPAQEIQDEIWEVLLLNIEVWCGLLQEPCPIPHERIESEQDLLVRVREEKELFFHWDNGLVMFQQAFRICPMKQIWHLF